MSQHLNIAAWGLQTVAVPSASCLQWSSDGQLIMTTKNAVYILTPDDGISVHPEAALKSSFVNEDGPRDSRPALGFFKTVIEFERAVTHYWPLLTADWAASSVGALDVYVRVVAVSPGDPVGSGTPVLAALNTNYELTLWSATKNHLRGAWIMIQDITAYLRDLPEGGALSETYNVLSAQASCIAWSSQSDFGLRPRTATDASLLAVGTRACGVQLLRLTMGEENVSCLRYVSSIAGENSQISHLAWSTWITERAGLCHSWLACGCSDGSVRLVRITQSLDISRTSEGISAPSIDHEQDWSSISLCEADGYGITAMRCVDTISGGRCFVIGKAGKVQIASWNLSAESWNNVHTLDLEDQDLTADSCAYYPVSGIEYIEHKDALVVSLFDGSFHVIGNLSANPQLIASNTSESLTTEGLSLQARTAFTRVETREARLSTAITRYDANRISGMTSYDHGGTFAWIHESTRPTDFSYKHDAKHTSFLVVSTLWTDIEANRWIARLCDSTAYDDYLGHSTMSVLRPIFCALRNGARTAQFAVEVVEALKGSQHAFELPEIEPPIADPNGDGVCRRAYRTSLTIHLFGWPHVTTLRRRVALAALMQDNTSRGSEIASAVQDIVSSLTSAVLQFSLWIILRHLSSATPQLSEDDIPLATRLGVQAMRSGGLEPLMLLGQQLMASLPGHHSENDQERSALPNVEERCPACDLEIKLEDALRAECQGGHTWQRCSITSFVLSTPMLRTCVGCSRKAFMPSDDSSPQPSMVRGWFAQELLRAVTRCLFCGNSFVALV